MKILIQNGQVIDPASQTNEIMDILIENGIISKMEKNITDKADTIINAQENWVTPGFIDVHVHLREPGYEYKETIATGTRSAAKGGFTTICCMPNTNPVCDSDIMVEYIKLKSQREGVVHVLPIGAITKGQNGEELSNIGKMAKAGACAISEDGKSVPSSGLLKTAMKYAKMFDIPVLSHCEDIALVAGGSINAGPSAQLLGLKGISNDSEEVIVARDIILAKSTNSKLHICHMSTKGSVEILKQAKLAGQNVTAEATPHHFTLSDDFITDYDGNTKMNPPLRSKEDVLAIRQALKDNIIEVIATDHAPHSIDEKNCEYERAAFGIVGLETALPLGITILIEEGWLTPMELIAKMTWNPAKMLGIDDYAGKLSVGKAADITIVNPNETYKVNPNTFASKNKNTPFGGFDVKGRVLYTIVDGNIIVANGKLVEELV